MLPDLGNDLFVSLMGTVGRGGGQNREKIPLGELTFSCLMDEVARGDRPGASRRARRSPQKATKKNHQ